MELTDNISICTGCGKKTNDDTETLFNYDADPYCKKCGTQQCSDCRHFIPDKKGSKSGTCYEGGYTETGDATDERTCDDEMWCNAHKTIEELS